MKKLYNVKKCILILSLFLVPVSLAGCKDKKDDIEYVTDSSATENKEDNTVVPDGNLLEEVWVEENITDRKSINAVVHADSMEGLKVITARKGYNTAEDRKELLTSFAETIYKDDKQFHTKKQIEQYIEDEKQNIANLESFQGNDVELERAYKRLAEYEEGLANATDEPVLADDYENLKYKVCSDGQWFKVDFSFLSSGFATGELLFILEEYANTDIGSYYGFPVVNTTTENFDDDVENDCKLSKDDAVNEALEFVEKLNIGDFSVVSVKTIKYEGLSSMDDYVGVTWYDGYEITLNRCVDDVTVDGYTTYPDRVFLGEMNNISEFRFKTGMEAISIRIDDRGVYLADYTNPLVITEVVSENVSVLSYESIKDIILEELVKDGTPSSYISYVNLSLVYFPLINGEETEITMIPAWRLDDGKIYGEMDNCIIINAMDGSVIDLQGRFVEVLN